jgi:hypothetical protein
VIPARRSSGWEWERWQRPRGLEFEVEKEREKEGQ